MLNYIIGRLKEPSTYAGFAGLALAVGITAEEWAAYSTAAAAIAGVVAMLLFDRGTADGAK
jgi:hypothetical protein